MERLKRLRNRHLFISDFLLLPLAVYLSYLLRLDKVDITPYWLNWLLFSLVMVMVTAAIFRAVGIYARYWLYASVDELLLLTGATTVSVIISAAVVAAIAWVAPAINLYPRSIPLILLLMALGVTAGPRLLLRLSRRYSRSREHAAAPRRVLVMGVGEAGAMIVREMRQKPYLGLEVVGLLDDDPYKQGMTIHGVQVMGGREEIPSLVRRLQVKQVIIAMPTASGKTIREIVALCEKANVATKIMPGIYELLDGTVSVSQLRDVDIEDLLRREPVQTDTRGVRELLAGKRVMVTGGGGSIGSELCRQILQAEPTQLIILGHGENSVFEIYHELRRWDFPRTQLRPIIADVRFAERLEMILQEVKPDIIFHAAAHKHVPLMEMNPAEAITNNIIGTRNLLRAAQAADVGRLVMISTDKAVNPTNLMGASKRAAELLVHQAAQESGLPYVAVRFGNVLGSRGSVVLTFKKQISRGGPVTITDPEMTRYFMTIPEAVQLVLQAAVLGHGGEVFVLDMGQPVKIMDLAKDLIELSGLEVGRDIDIKVIGPRPGEKLFEELFIKGEDYRRTAHEKVFVAMNASSFVPPELDSIIDYLELLASRNDHRAIVRNLQSLLPEYRPIQPAGQAATPRPQAVYKEMSKQVLAVESRQMGELKDTIGA